MDIQYMDGTIRVVDGDQSYAWPKYMTAPISSPLLDAVTSLLGDDAVFISMDNEGPVVQVAGEIAGPDHPIAQAVAQYG